MSSPYCAKDPVWWVAELEGQLDDLQASGVDFSIPRDVSVEIAGPPYNRERLRDCFVSKGWQAMPGIGTEPNATMFLVKTAAWTEEAILKVQADMLESARQFGCVFEGLCYHEDSGQ